MIHKEFQLLCPPTRVEIRAKTERIRYKAHIGKCSKHKRYHCYIQFILEVLKYIKIIAQ